MTKEQLIELSRRVDELNAKYPTGTPVRYWPGARKGEGVKSEIRSAWAIYGNGQIVTWVNGHSACVARSNIEVLLIRVGAGASA